MWDQPHFAAQLPSPTPPPPPCQVPELHAYERTNHKWAARVLCCRCCCKWWVELGWWDGRCCSMGAATLAWVLWPRRRLLQWQTPSSSSSWTKSGSTGQSKRHAVNHSMCNAVRQIFVCELLCPTLYGRLYAVYQYYILHYGKYQCHMAASCTYHLPTIIS